MAKAHTNLKQSKMLAEILRIESADMSWAGTGLGKPFARTSPCKGYRPGVGTNKGEINCACVDEEKRTITKCDYTESKGCWMCPITKGGAQ